MTNNDIFKKLRVALMLRDDQIVEILELVDFRISKSELGAFFRDEKHENYVECGDQVLRNFLNGLVIHLRGTKDNPRNPSEVLSKHKAQIPAKENGKPRPEFTPKVNGDKTVGKTSAKSNFKKNISQHPKDKKDGPEKKIQVVEKVKFNNGKNKKS